MLDKLTEFVLEYSTYKDRKALEERIAKHIEYKTYLVAYDNQGDIAGCCLWVIDGDTCRILDCIIKNEYRNNGMMKSMLQRGLAMWPVAKNISFNRDYNEDGHDRWPEDRTYDIQKMLRRL